MHVLVMSIGPVQELIASARKCRDLWFGSWLLSELSRATAKAIVGAEGGDESKVLVFPGARADDTGRSVANKVVARISGDPSEVARRAEAAMRARLTEIRDPAFSRVGHGHRRRDDFFDETTARQQVDDLIELQWASAVEGASYAAAREEAERLLAAAKSSKSWSQPPWARDRVAKSSLDGVRESVLHESLYDRPRGGAEPAAVGDKARRAAFGVHGAERLCGVGLLKRFGNRDTDDRGRSLDPLGPAERIFSTSHVASGPFRAGLAALDAGGHWARFLDALEGLPIEALRDVDVVPVEDDVTGRVDGSVFYEARLAEEIEEQGGTPEHARTAVDALRGFLRSVSRLG